jgi:hypothetical protein
LLPRVAAAAAVCCCRCCCVLPVLLLCMCPQVNIEVDVRFVRDMLKGDDAYELRVCLKEHKDESFPFKDDD